MAKTKKKLKKGWKTCESLEELINNIKNGNVRYFLDNDSDICIYKMIEHEEDVNEYDVEFDIYYLPDDLRELFDSLDYIDSTENTDVYGTTYENFCDLFIKFIKFGRLSYPKRQ